MDPEHPDGPRDFIPGAPGKPADYGGPEEKRAALERQNKEQADDRTGGNYQRALLLGGPMSRCGLHIDDLGWTSWIAVIRGAKLFYLWPGDVDRKAAFALSDAQAMNPEKGGIHLLTQFDPFREQSPEMEAMFEETGRSYGDELWDWEARDALSPQRSTPLPPIKPVECIAKAGEILVTWDNWHTALNLEASLAVGRSYLDKWGLPFYLWRIMLLRKDFGFAVVLMANVIRLDTAGKATLFDALKVVRDLSANVKASGSPGWLKVQTVHAAYQAEVETKSTKSYYNKVFLAFAESGVLREVAAASLRALIGDAELTDAGLDALAARVAAKWDERSDHQDANFSASLHNGLDRILQSQGTKHGYS